MAALCRLRKTLFPPSLVRCLRYRKVLPSKTSIHQMKKNILLNHCAGTKTNIVMSMLRSIAPAINLETAGKKTTLQVFFEFFSRPASPSSIYDILLLSLMVLRTTAKKENTFRGSSSLFARNCRQELQRTTFKRAQSAILQGRDFNLRVESALKIPYPRS